MVLGRFLPLVLYSELRQRRADIMSSSWKQEQQRIGSLDTVKSRAEWLFANLALLYAVHGRFTLIGAGTTNAARQKPITFSRRFLAVKKFAALWSLTVDGKNNYPFRSFSSWTPFVFNSNLRWIRKILFSTMASAFETEGAFLMQEQAPPHDL